MEVRIIKDFEAEMYLHGGSVVQDVTELNGVYTGLWCSMLGSFTVSFPIEYGELTEC